ncbi:MAG: bifunctional 4-hydroxy-2-oxoglutarate aldolase/2-dehydro-3-deoxy-phosphogluconate aldolase [Candidatus Hydrogenedentota bacterium]
MPMNDVFAAIQQYAVAPVIAIESEASALPLADALIAGGLPIAEITFRTEAAGAVIERLTRERPELLVGAGTVLTIENLEAAHAAGAQFAVAPGLNPAVVRRANELGLPFIPGIMTPSDIEAGLALGCYTLKFFPAGALGGAAMIKAIAGPYRHTGVRFMPTGGVNADNLAGYLALPEVAAVGGTWIAKKDDIAARAWKAISARCRAIGEIRNAARP